ncbi:MAG: response regulator transcription factor, partial [Verrucomicrobia bacterium]|nr:response regulator transcription factor [Verrucomicrobiota bacterium]
MKKLRILIADDHSMIRHGLKALIESKSEWELCGAADNGRMAVDLALKTQPDIAVLDITMPELNGLDATRQIRAALPSTHVLILTMHDSDALAREVLEAGARGYVLKNDAPELLPQAIESLAAGRAFFTSRIS